MLFKQHFQTITSRNLLRFTYFITFDTRYKFQLILVTSCTAHILCEKGVMRWKICGEIIINDFRNLRLATARENKILSRFCSRLKVGSCLEARESALKWKHFGFSEEFTVPQTIRVKLCINPLQTLKIRIIQDGLWPLSASEASSIKAPLECWWREEIKAFDDFQHQIQTMELFRHFATQITKCFHWTDITKFCRKLSKVSKACLSLKFLLIVGELSSQCLCGINQVSQQYHIECQLFLIDSFYEWIWALSATNGGMTVFENARAVIFVSSRESIVVTNPLFARQR